MEIRPVWVGDGEAAVNLVVVVDFIDEVEAVVKVETAVFVVVGFTLGASTQ